MTGLFCPCMLFGRNVENLNDEIPANNACMCHLLCIEGGMALAAITAFVPGMDPSTSCLITEGLFFAWWMCGIYTGMARQTLQRKYHLKVHNNFFNHISHISEYWLILNINLYRIRLVILVWYIVAFIGVHYVKSTAR